MSEFNDKEIACKECGTAFIWTAGEQEFFANKGLVNMPSRCPICRKKAEVKHDYATTHDIECKNCRKKSKSPFNPSDPQNILCQECFEKATAVGGVPPEAGKTTDIAPEQHSNVPKSTPESTPPTNLSPERNDSGVEG